MLEQSSTILVCIDFQRSLTRVMVNREDLFKNTRKLISGLGVLDIPILWTEQHPRMLGPTVPEIAECMPDNTPISKMSFSCCLNEEFMKSLKAANRRQVLICGIEAHICVYQTALDLMSMAYEVQVVADCVSSRTLENKTTGLEKTKNAGADVTSAEIVLFELLKTAESPKFKNIVKIVK
jgi:isochorismate hydrolase